ncbi:MAG: aspartate--tRNA(Asn) ligase [Candidatus Micrarchaeia archaeon]
MHKIYVKDLSADMGGKEVVVAGWVHEVRELGSITFLLLRDSTGIVQVTAKKGVTDPTLIKQMALPKESVVEIEGTIAKNSTARMGFEIIPKKISNLNPLSAQIPFEVTGKVPAYLDVRLDYRYVDLRTAESRAVFRIQSTILQAFRKSLLEDGFQEIITPEIVAEATEGGADLFEIKYFEDKAYLAQSPQIYKQSAIIGGMEKVFMLSKAFRAEKSNTLFHLTESTQLDIEMAFADDNDAIFELVKVFKDIIKEVKNKNSDDLKTLSVDLEVPDIKKITYTQAIEALREQGIQISFGDDISREQENKICELFGEAVIVTGYPTAIRAFYSMPSEEDPKISKSYDLLYRGAEVLSGAQRIHKPEMLIEAIKAKGLNPTSFSSYINAFRCGAPPHAGWSIGLERLTKQITKRENIRECSLFPRDRKRLTP